MTSADTFPPEHEPAPQSVSGWAIASLVLAFLGPCSLLGLILGIVALVKISSSGGRLGGRGLAIAGICVSILVLLFSLVLLPALMLPVLGRAREAARRVSSAGNMSQVGKACVIAAGESPKEDFPTDPYTLYPKYITDPRVFMNVRFPGQSAGYVYVSGLNLNDPLAVLLYENIVDASRSPGRNMLLANGAVQWCDEREFARLLAETKQKAQAEGRKLTEIPIDYTRMLQQNP